jgi:formylglycine-generating enzyme required for sulfatase activity
MADIFISFNTDDTARVQPVFDGFRSRGLTVFWSNDIPPGSPNYQAIIKAEIHKAPVVIVLWTHASVDSHAVAQECSQAERDNKLIQVLLDDIAPIDFPMEVRFKAQKAMLFGWTNDQGHPEWIKLNNAIDVRLGRRPGAIPVESGIPGRSQTRYFLPGAGKTERFQDYEHGPEMVVVPAGTFFMGSPENEADSTEKDARQHKVTILQPFAVARHATTRGQFGAFVKNTKYEMEGNAFFWTGDDLKSDPKWSWFNPAIAQDDSHPVVCVNWNDAKAYAEWLSDHSGKSYRLLSEAEWEYMARAGTTTPFWWGASITPEQANYKRPLFGGGSQGEYREATVPVASFEANPWGLLNVHGNVCEWCEDVWHNTYNGAPTDGSPWLQGGNEKVRVIRGGSWASSARTLRSAYREGWHVSSRFNDRGFRLARTLNP